MRLFHGSKIRSIIIGLVLAKIFIAGVYLVAALKPIHLACLTSGIAVAQAEPPAMPQAASQTGAPSAATPATPTPGAAAPADAPLLQPKDIQAVMDSLEKKRQELQEKEADLKQEQARLDSLKLEIEDKIQTLSKVQKKIEDDLNRKQMLATQAEQKQKAEEEKHIKQLVKVYTSMKPKNAAAIVDKLDLNIVFQVFRAMKGEQVGKILTYVDQNRAATISEWLATKKGD
jgi:flagellar motility protein MotE (MotC chaperone)